jgi:hypothetical protein
MSQDNECLREAVGVFHDKGKLDTAVAELSKHFPREFLSVLASEETLKEKCGGKDTVNPLNAMDNKDVPRAAPVKPEENVIGTSAAVGGGAYIGAVAAALSAGAVSMPILTGVAVIGANSGGSASGAATAIFKNRNADHIEKQLDAGGLLLWVGTPSEDKEHKALEILKRNGATDIEVHDIK